MFCNNCEKPGIWRKAARWIGCIALALAFTGCDMPVNRSELQSESRKLLRQTLEERFAEIGGDVAQYVKVGDIDNFTLVNESGNKYTGIADVTIEVTKGYGAKKKVRFDVNVTYDGENILLETQANDVDAFLEFLVNAGISD